MGLPVSHPVNLISSSYHVRPCTACVDAEATGDHLHPLARPLFQHAAESVAALGRMSV